MAVTAEVQQAIEQAVASALAGVSSAGTASNVVGSQASDVTETLQKSIASLTEQLTKMQTESQQSLKSQTEDVLKSIDIGGDEAQKRGMAGSSDEWDGIAHHRASLLARSAGIVDWAMQNAVFANSIAQLSTVREFDQQGSHNWRKRCGEPPANPAEGNKAA